MKLGGSGVTVRVGLAVGCAVNVTLGVGVIVIVGVWLLVGTPTNNASGDVIMLFVGVGNTLRGVTDGKCVCIALGCEGNTAKVGKGRGAGAAQFAAKNTISGIIKVKDARLSAKTHPGVRL